MGSVWRISNLIWEMEAHGYEKHPSHRLFHELGRLRALFAQEGDDTGGVYQPQFGPYPMGTVKGLIFAHHLIWDKPFLDQCFGVADRPIPCGP